MPYLPIALIVDTSECNQITDLCEHDAVTTTVRTVAEPREAEDHGKSQFCADSRQCIRYDPIETEINIYGRRVSRQRTPRREHTKTRQ